MFLLLITAVIVLFVIQWFITNFCGYWKRRGVPHPYALPWIGNLGPSLIMTKALGQIFTDIYNDYKDYSYVGFYKMQKPSLLVRDQELIKTVLIKEFPSFHDNDVNVTEKDDPIISRNPFVLRGHQWKLVRTQITSAITTGKIKSLFNLIMSVNKNLIKHLNQEIEQQKVVDAKELSAKYTTDVVATCAFGLESNSLINKDSEFRKMGQKMINTSFFTTIKFVLLFTMPSLTNYINISVIPRPARDWFVGILKETIKYRKTNNISRKDYLDMMIELKSKPGEYEFTDMDVIAQAMTFFFDGFETSSIALSFALYELGKNPEVQKKLQSEIDAVMKKCNGEITYENLQECIYLNMVFSETLRKNPPALFLIKKCTQPFTFPSPKKDGSERNIRVECDTAILIPIYAIHHDPTHYPDPEKFIPERFTDEAKANRPKCTYMPFGEGPRMCLGSRFATLQIKAALFTIVYNFDVRVNSKTTPTFELDPKNFAMGKKGGIWLDFQKRFH